MPKQSPTPKNVTLPDPGPDHCYVRVPRAITAWVSRLDDHATFDLAGASPRGVEYIVRYGFKQSVNDRFADPKRTCDRDAVDAVVKRIHEGDVTPGRGGPRIDPVFKHVRSAIYAALRKAKRVKKTDKMADVLPDMEACREAVKTDAAWDAVVKAAEAKAEAERATPGADAIDLA